MKIAIHQPNFLPWLGYFYKWFKSDLFVMYDDVQFSKGSYINRNQILTHKGILNLTVPVLTKHKSLQLIKDTQINHEDNWNKKIISTIAVEYSKAKYFEVYFGEFVKIIKKAFVGSLVDLNIKLLLWAADILGIHVPIIKSSRLRDVQGASTERLVSICKLLDADTYISGAGGMNYQEEALFAEAGITLVVLPSYKTHHPRYKQVNECLFVQNLSVLDLIMNCGSEGRKFFK